MFNTLYIIYNIKTLFAGIAAFNNKWYDCTTWSKRANEVQAIINPGSGDFDQVARVYFVQYHLHVQLLEASKYCESRGVALKGDLPIGVTRCSQVR